MTKANRDRVHASVWRRTPDWARELDDAQPYEVQYLDADGVSYIFGLTEYENGGLELACARWKGYEAAVFPRQKLSAISFQLSAKAAAAGGGR